MHPLALLLHDEYKTAEKDRLDIEEKWVRNLRQYKGQYEPDVLARLHPNRSRVFVKLTRTKVISAEARLGELLFPSGDKNWGIDPTPVAEVPDEVIQQIVEELGEQATEETVLHKIREWARHGAEAMAREIDDQLKEMDYQSIGRKVIHDACVFGTGVLKGPTNLTVMERRFAAVQGVYAVTEQEQVRPYVERIPVWDLYPDMHAGSFREGNYVYHRHIFTKSRMEELMEREDFDGEAIKRYLNENPKGDVKELKGWESDTREMSQTDTLSPAHKGRFEVLERWGVMDSVELERLMDRQGLEADLPQGRDIETIIFTVGDEVIKAIPNWSEMKIRPFHLFSLELDDTGIFGPGIPEVIEDSQTIVNTGTRMLLDNAASTWRSMVAVDRAALDTDDDPSNVYPGRTWVFDSRKLPPGAGHEPVFAIDIPSHIPELMQIIDLGKKHADEETAMPSVVHGGEDTDSRRTLGEVSMRLGASNLVLRDIVKNWDNGITTPFITAMFHWNMQFNPDESIKRDAKVVARGSTHLVAKEVRGPAAELFAQGTMNEFDAPHVNRRGLLRIRAEANDLPAEQVLWPEDQVEFNEQARAEEAQRAQEAQDADNELKRAKAERELAEGERALSQAEESEAGALERRVSASVEASTAGNGVSGDRAA